MFGGYRRVVFLLSPLGVFVNSRPRTASDLLSGVMGGYAGRGLGALNLSTSKQVCSVVCVLVLLD